MGRTRRPDLAQKSTNMGRSMGRTADRSRRRLPPHTGPTQATGLLRTASAALLGGWVGLVLDALLQRPTAVPAHRRPGRPRPP
jgi:hypothetical protein